MVGPVSRVCGYETKKLETFIDVELSLLTKLLIVDRSRNEI